MHSLDLREALETGVEGLGRGEAVTPKPTPAELHATPSTIKCRSPYFSFLGGTYLHYISISFKAESALLIFSKNMLTF